MQKSSTMRTSGKKILKGQLTIGLDLGDRSSSYCVLNEAGEIVLEQKLPTTPEALKQTFAKMPRSRLAMETGTHSPWVSRLLTELGHEVIVAHAQNVRLIVKSRRKDDAWMHERWRGWTHRSGTPESGATSQCSSPVAPDRDPSPSGTGKCSNGSGECRTRIGEVARPTVAQVWHLSSPSGNHEWIEHRIARSLAAVVARGGIVK